MYKVVDVELIINIISCHSLEQPLEDVFFCVLMRRIHCEQIIRRIVSVQLHGSTLIL